MINTVLFDLDGTLLRFEQNNFINSYFGRLKKVFVNLGIDPELAAKGVWVGTKAMTQNDGSRLNCECFWDAFSAFMKFDEKTRKAAEIKCDEFYSGDFDNVREILEPSDVPARLIPALREHGLTVALATNPLFPECAVTTRLKWIGLTPGDFALITHYANSRFCKPNPEYFRDVLNKLGKQPDECIMVGNNVDDDMSAIELGMEAYLVTDFAENESGKDLSIFNRGTQAEMEKYLAKLY